MEGEMLKGHLDMIVLAALSSGPAHGYAVIQEIQRRSGGAFELETRNPHACRPAGDLAALRRCDRRPARTSRPCPSALRSLIISMN
jgi:hypothetical protein